MVKKLLNIVLGLLLLILILFGLTSLNRPYLNPGKTFTVELSEYKDYSVNYIKSYTNSISNDVKLAKYSSNLEKYTTQDILIKSKNSILLFDITCPSNIAVNNDLGQCSAIVNYTTPTTTSPNTVIQTAGLASGLAFPIGTTINTFWRKRWK